MSPGAWSLPIGAALGYSLGVLAIQRALASGVSGARVNLFCNTVMALVFQLFWLVPCRDFTLQGIGWPLLCGGFFFLGQILTFRAIAAGDVSVSTPLLGTKVIFVALFTVLIARTPLPGTWWWACLMVSAGIALISYERDSSGRGVGESVLWSLAAAAVFALTDLLVQLGVPRVGYPRFAPIMFGSMGILSLVHLPRVLRQEEIFRFSPAASRTGGRAESWLLTGALVLAIQALAMYSAIGFYGSATLTNILYGSRCLWTVALSWVLASAMTQGEGKHSHRAMGRRLLGAILLVASMVLVLGHSGR